MGDYKEHHFIKELIQKFGSTASYEDCLNVLNIGSSVHTSNYNVTAQEKHIQEVLRSASHPQLFLHKYNELLEKKVDCLGSFVELLYMINKDSVLKKLLKKINKTQPSQFVQSEMLTKEVTKDDIPDIKTKIYNAVAKERSKTSKIKMKLVDNLSSPHSHISADINNSNESFSTDKMTDWIIQRPYMSWDFITDINELAPSHFSTSLPAPAIPHISQENILIDNLLYVLNGVEGSIIEPLPVLEPYASREFTIHQEVDGALQNLIRAILPLASHYSIIQRFNEEHVKFEYGQVNHALVAAMGGMLKDYLYFTCQLEGEHRSENLTLQKLWFYVQGNMLSMGVMAEIATTIGKANAKGGKVLSLLYNHLTCQLADVRAYELCVHLIERTAKPYMAMLSTWIYTGIINDPFKEFLVEDNHIVTKEPIEYDTDDFWEKRYSVRRDRTPIFLEKVSDVILRTGKYLNVVRQCGKPIKTEAKELVYHPKDNSYIESIHKAYFTASNLLQNLLMQENDLIGRLRSVKRYFLLEQGDFIVQFMDLCEKELSKNINEVVLPRLEALFELALRLSGANNDPYKDDMRIELLQYNLQTQMMKILLVHFQDQPADHSSDKLPLTGLESFSFGYEVKWPVSLVLHRRAIACYQMIFRHLFFCKHVERQICRVWICNKEAKCFRHNEATQYRNAFTLRQKMLNCVQNLEYHMMVEVIEPYWQSFRDKVTKMVDIDEVLKCHDHFLDLCLKDCMLTKQELLQTVTKLLYVCMDFCTFIQQSPEHSLTSSMSMSMSASMFASEIQLPPTQPAAPITENDSFEKNIERFDQQFSTILLDLMSKINELGRQNTNDKLVNLLYRTNVFWCSLVPN